MHIRRWRCFACQLERATDRPRACLGRRRRMRVVWRIYSALDEGIQLSADERVGSADQRVDNVPYIGGGCTRLMFFSRG